MKIAIKISALLCVGLLSATVGLAADRKQLSDAVAAVDANLKTDAGKQYDAKIGEEFPAKYVDAVRKCKQSNPKHGDPFDLFLKLSSDGEVQQALAYPETAFAVCVRTALESGRFSAPPRGDYWINIHLQLKP